MSMETIPMSKKGSTSRFTGAEIRRAIEAVMRQGLCPSGVSALAPTLSISIRDRLLSLRSLPQTMTGQFGDAGQLAIPECLDVARSPLLLFPSPWA